MRKGRVWFDKEGLESANLGNGLRRVVDNHASHCARRLRLRFDKGSETAAAWAKSWLAILGLLLSALLILALVTTKLQPLGVAFLPAPLIFVIAIFDRGSSPRRVCVFT